MINDEISIHDVSFFVQKIAGNPIESIEWLIVIGLTLIVTGITIGERS